VTGKKAPTRRKERKDPTENQGTGLQSPVQKWTLALALWLVPLVNPPLVSPIGRLTPLLRMPEASMGSVVASLIFST
jgi:hypothetical protein